MTESSSSNSGNTLPVNFIQNIINQDIENQTYNRPVHTRFPPEPNGYLHIGHAKSICLNFGIAAANNGLCNLRFDDTNPLKEDVEYVESIIEDVKWLGFDWEDRLFYASDFFDQLYEYAVELIKAGQAYVCDLNAAEIREYRGTLTEPGKESPYRDRTVEENLQLFAAMKNGEYPEGYRVLRAKIDMASPNINMRDPVLYRVFKAAHHRTGDKWCIYPMYDYAHPLSDAIENITHSICTLEFEDHRPLYDWVLQALNIQIPPKQIEFARLNLTNTVMSKRKLKELVDQGHVQGWDDPRMPTISGLRRRGYTPEAIRDFCDRIGVAKSNSIVDISLLEHCIREELNKKALRVMAVLRPLKVVILNYPEEHIEELDAENNPEEPGMGTRKIPFSRELYIEETDFLENPSKKYFRLAPDREVRLKHAYIIKCVDYIKDEETGRITELHCTYYPESKSGSDTSGRKVKGTLHWVSAKHARKAEVRLFDHLFIDDNAEEENQPDLNSSSDGDIKVNPKSMEKLTTCLVEPGLTKADPEKRYQFLRHGYFFVDAKDTTEDMPVFNRIVSLRDTWAKIQKRK